MSAIHEINIVDSTEIIKNDRVLIVDDEPYNIDSLKVIVQCATFETKNFNLK